MPTRTRVKTESLPLESTTSINNDVVGEDQTPMQVINDEEDNNDDDMIVREMDVYLSPELAHQLYLLQFPLQQHSQTSSSYSLYPQAARIKPRHNMVELDQAIPTNIERDGTGRMLHRTYASHTVPVTTHLALGKILPDNHPPSSTTSSNTFAIANNNNNNSNSSNNNSNNNNNNRTALHLVPLTHITQMRPTFKHIDDEDEANQSEDDLEEEKAAAVQKEKDKKPLMFQKKESERAALARLNSYAFKKASEEGEGWSHLEVHDEESSEYDLLMQTFECPLSWRNKSILDIGHQQEAVGMETATTTTTTHTFTPSLTSYVHSLNYLPTATASSIYNSNSNIQGTNFAGQNIEYADAEENRAPTACLDLKQAAMDDTPIDIGSVGAHLTTLLCRGAPIPFSILRHTVPSSVPDTDVLTALASCAVMVRGNFVLQSRLMQYPRPLAKARTFILLLLQSMGVIHRNRLEEVYGLSSSSSPSLSSAAAIPPQQQQQQQQQQQHPKRRQPKQEEEKEEENNDHQQYQEAHVNSETLLVILNQVARKATDGWVLKVQDDAEIFSKFPDNTSLHMQYWGRQMLRFRDYLERYSAVQ